MYIHSIIIVVIFVSPETSVYVMRKFQMDRNSASNSNTGSVRFTWFDQRLIDHKSKYNYRLDWGLSIMEIIILISLQLFDILNLIDQISVKLNESQKRIFFGK